MHLVPLQPGDHVDFVVGDRLIHIVTAGDNVNGDCGSDCHAFNCGGGGGTVLEHELGPGLVDHGRLNIARSRVGHGEADEEDVGGGGGGGGGGGTNAKAPTVPRAAIGGGRYLPLVHRDAGKNEGDDVDAEKDAAAQPLLTSVEAVHLALTIEHAGGAEASTHTRLKVHGICCPSEVPLIHSILDHRPGVRSVKAGPPGAR
jgi:hypothetical protein